MAEEQSFVSMEDWQALSRVGYCNNRPLHAQSVGSSPSQSISELQDDSPRRESYLSSSSKVHDHATSASSNLQAMISLTLHHYTSPHPWDLHNPPILRILGHCEKEELESWKTGLKDLIDSSIEIHHWNRHADGRIADSSETLGRGPYMILGLPFSSLFKQKYITPEIYA